MQSLFSSEKPAGEKYIYLYDGSFEGLLTAVATAIKSKQQVLCIVDNPHYQPHLFCQTVAVVTSRNQAERLMRYLHSLQPTIAETIICAWLSEQHDTGLHLYHFVRHCLRVGSRAIDDYSDNATRYLLTLSRKTKKEVHRYQGLLRFYRMDNQLLYAPFSPKYNIITLCTPHFRRRIKNEQWIIHDLQRDLALLWDGKQLTEIEIDPDFSNHVKRHGQPPQRQLAAGEKEYQRLWQTFHHAISNAQRQNRALQKKYIPQRYWRYLVERQQP